MVLQHWLLTNARTVPGSSEYYVDVVIVNHITKKTKNRFSRRFYFFTDERVVTVNHVAKNPKKCFLKRLKIKFLRILDYLAELYFSFSSETNTLNFTDRRFLCWTTTNMRKNS